MKNGPDLRNRSRVVSHLVIRSELINVSDNVEQLTVGESIF